MKKLVVTQFQRIEFKDLLPQETNLAIKTVYIIIFERYWVSD